MPHPRIVAGSDIILAMDADAGLAVRLTRVAAKLKTAASMAGEPVMFGASSHCFHLGSPLAEAIVADFERQHAVTLPADYRAFITTVGHGGSGRHGGAGPYYGLHPLQDWAAGLWGMPAANTLATPFRAEPGRIYDDWLAEVAPGDDAEPYTGTLALSDEGCGYLTILVISGPARGRVTDTYEIPTDRRSHLTPTSSPGTSVGSMPSWLAKRTSDNARLGPSGSRARSTSLRSHLPDPGLHQ